MNDSLYLSNLLFYHNFLYNFLDMNHLRNFNNSLNYFLYYFLYLYYFWNCSKYFQYIIHIYSIHYLRS